MLSFLLLLAAQAPPPGEEAVDPYPMANANAGATPIGGDSVWRAFNGAGGTRRIVDETVRLSVADSRIADTFKSHDLVRLRRTLFEQFCYLLGGSCDYTGRDMRATHKDMGLQTADLNALIENLQAAMRKEGVPFAAQNRLLAKLAPMKRDVVER